MATVVRRGTLHDLSALLALDDVAQSNEQRRRLLQQGLRDAAVSVALVDGTPKGYLVLNYHFFGNAFIELVYVCASARRSGIGSALVRHVLHHASGSRLFTSTNQSNAPMQALLAQLQFEASGIIHNLDPGDPELVYFKRLPGAADP